MGRVRPDVLRPFIKANGGDSPGLRALELDAQFDRVRIVYGRRSKGVAAGKQS